MHRPGRPNKTEGRRSLETDELILAAATCGSPVLQIDAVRLDANDGNPARHLAGGRRGLRPRAGGHQVCDKIRNSSSRIDKLNVKGRPSRASSSALRTRHFGGKSIRAARRSSRAAPSPDIIFMLGRHRARPISESLLVTVQEVSASATAPSG